MLVLTAAISGPRVLTGWPAMVLIAYLVALGGHGVRRRAARKSRRKIGMTGVNGWPAGG